MDKVQKKKEDLTQRTGEERSQISIRFFINKEKNLPVEGTLGFATPKVSRFWALWSSLVGNLNRRGGWMAKNRSGLRH